jgi:hypothetical protein
VNITQTCFNQEDVLKLVLTKFGILDKFESHLKQPLEEYYNLVNNTARPIYWCIEFDTPWILYPSYKRMISVNNFCKYLHSELEYVNRNAPEKSPYAVQEMIVNGLTGHEILKSAVNVSDAYIF